MAWSRIVAKREIRADPVGLWTAVVDYVEGPMLLKISASGTWFYATGRACSPDGDFRSLLLPSRMLFAGAPVGALIGKIGGSSAGNADGMVFLVGTRCIVTVPEDTRGMLFLTINDEYSGMTNNSGSLSVRILQRPYTPPPPKHPASAAASATAPPAGG